MKGEYEEDGMRPEYDFSQAVRGKFGNRWTPEERETLLRESAQGSVRTLNQYALEEVRELQAALFVLLKLSGADRVGTRAFSELVENARNAVLLDPPMINRLQFLVHENEWLAQPRNEPYTGPGSLNSVHGRIEGDCALARELKAQIEGKMEQQLMDDGFSTQEIERKTEEAARLWRAA
jgi:hypothetical protein